MLIDLLKSSYFSLFLIVALGFMLGRIKIKGLSLDVSAVIFIALLFGHFGVIIPKELGNFGLVLFIFTIGIQAGPGFFDSFRSKGKTLIILTVLIILSAGLTAVGLKYAFDIDTPSVVGLIAGALTSTPGLAVAIDSTNSPLASIAYGIAWFTAADKSNLGTGNPDCLYISLLASWILGALITWFLYRRGKWRQKALSVASGQ